MEEPISVPKISVTRLNIVMLGLSLSLFVSMIEITIVSTALFKISDDLLALDKSQWVIVSYLLTFTAFQLIVAHLSDVIGQKFMLVSGNVIFLAFSLACGFARTMDQLIIFRALQGVGGAAVNSLVFIVMMTLATKQQVGFYTALVGSVSAFSNFLGPVLGGLVTDHVSWRWIFYLNAPVCVAVLLIILPAMPADRSESMTKNSLARIDVVGGLLSVVWAIPFVFAIQEGGAAFPWKSAVIVGTLTGGIVGCILFLCWERHIGKSQKQDQVLPMWMLIDPIVSLALLSVMLFGFAFFSAVLLLPQRFQAVNGATPTQAGFKLLALTLSSPVFAVVAGAIMSRNKSAAQYLLLIGASLVAIATGLLSSLGTEFAVSHSVYGFQVILGTGFGLLLTPSFYILKAFVPEKDISTSMGALNMARALGGGISVSICAAVLHSTLNADLPDFLDHEQIGSLKTSLEILKTLPSRKTAKVRVVFGKAYNRQFQVMLAFALANVLVTGILLVNVNKRVRNIALEVGEGTERVDDGEERKSQERVEAALEEEMTTSELHGFNANTKA
ncbi:hypothetical protein EG328_005726 [Venturia inaequalis]|uniref:Major facilitator superfamily (MFS) profile domain-containing protein n=1 Tax=Venturia inaequalis TaxID=5025 RepID=A0A8H3YRY6_VENIN|nr:hypothetical protein EG327_002260 [Venturia inaequalis]KAE9971365.1 hypothetical protein EG328_005726 [Venturia inaequalis]